eukprot:CAMPEP_0115059558 /NCGR_PEP_ID=MMETSP0227-20121206/6986_1 /TAXON_ID=89957 /ORGANISM="Polarella glacialis, Strain CCMP 1383" /LENGTH=557 /DNA_ID=CAMNT_0002444697 /DNA_START=1 /DNA_END=1673 /DNA_ORIENTATION=+
MAQQPSSRIGALARHLSAPRAEVEVEDLALRAWPDASGGGCDSCGSGSCGSGKDQQSQVPKNVLFPAATAATPLSALAWPAGAPVEEPEIRTAEEYINSLRGRIIKVFIQGEEVRDYVDHPIVWPSVNALAETYRLAQENPALGSAIGFSGVRMSRFLHIAESAEDLVLQSHMQRELGRRTGTCFQRCVGMDAANAMWSTTFDIDQKHGSSYHQRFQDFLKTMQKQNCVIGGAMTDVKGDRMLTPSQQEDPDLFVHIHRRLPNGGIVLRGAKAHQTGTLNSHWMIVMPGAALKEADKDYAVCCAIPIDAPGITYIYGRQSCDLRAMEVGNEIDQGNAKFGGQETMVCFEDVEVPPELVFMDGEVEFTGLLVERFTAYHRRSYVCKAGLGDVMLGAAATVSDYNGTSKASHIKDKLVEIAFLNETIAGTALAASYGGKPTPSSASSTSQGMPYEIARLTQDLAGGFLVTLPGDKEFSHPVAGALLEKYMKAKKGVTVENRRRILRLIENMTMGRNAVGYLSESMHGAGSPQAQRVLIARLMDLEAKKKLAKHLAGIVE